MDILGKDILSKNIYLITLLFSLLSQSSARVAELVDASVSKTDNRKVVRVRFPPRVQAQSE